MTQSLQYPLTGLQYKQKYISLKESNLNLSRRKFIKMVPRNNGLYKAVPYEYEVTFKWQ